jgi:serine kinase of HPr protein (carbohydrate metabolism regulator)
MRFTKLILVIAVSLMTFASVAQAQQGKGRAPMMKPQTMSPDSISDQQLKMVAKGMQKAQQVRMQAQADMKKLVEAEGLSYKRFQQIMMSKSKKAPKKVKQKVNVTEAEKAKMDSLRPKIQATQKSARKEMMQAIESTGMSTKKFQAIVNTLRQNKKLAKRYKKISKKVRKSSSGMKGSGSGQ